MPVIADLQKVRITVSGPEWEPEGDPAWDSADVAERAAYWHQLAYFAYRALLSQMLAGLDGAGRRMRPRKRPRADGADGAVLSPHYSRSRFQRLLRWGGKYTRGELGRAELWWEGEWAEIVGYHARGEVRGAPVRNVLGLSADSRARVKRQALAWWKGRPDRGKAVGPDRLTLSDADRRAVTNASQGFHKLRALLGLPGLPPIGPGPVAPAFRPPGGPPKPRPAAGGAPKPKPKPKPKPELDVRGNLTPEDVRPIREAIDGLPPFVLEALARNRAKIVYAESLAAYDPALAAKRPRGWPEGMTWLNAEGLYRAGRFEIVVCRLRKPGPVGALVPSGRQPGVLRHETGHGFDDALRHYTKANIEGSRTAAFRKAYASDLGKVPRDGRFDYYLQGGDAGPEEAFAEVFGQLAGGGADSYDILEHFPRCAALIRILMAGQAK